MSYFAAALARTPTGWTAREMDLDDASDVDELADRVRDVSSDAQTALLFVEEDDEYLAILRIDAEADEPRIFVSDAHAADSYPVAELFAEAVEETEPEPPADDEDDPPGHDFEPLGDADLLADLGVSSRQLLTLCATEGMLPADVTAEIGQLIGFADEVDALREVA